MNIHDAVRSHDVRGPFFDLPVFDPGTFRFDGIRIWNEDTGQELYHWRGPVTRQQAANAYDNAVRLVWDNRGYFEIF